MGVIGGMFMAAAALLGYLGTSRRLTMTLLALTVVLSALKAGRESQWLWLRELTGKKNRLMREKTLPIRHIAADCDMMLGQLASRFLPHRYHLITVLDEACRPIATLSENEVVEALMTRGAHTRIFAIFSAKG
jgi:stage IV sporulation protein FB